MATLGVNYTLSHSYKEYRGSTQLPSCRHFVLSNPHYSLQNICPRLADRIQKRGLLNGAEEKLGGLAKCFTWCKKPRLKQQMELRNISFYVGIYKSLHLVRGVISFYKYSYT